MRLHARISHLLLELHIQFLNSGGSRNSERIRVADFFAGSGGHSLGLYMCDMDVDAYEWEASHGKHSPQREFGRYIPDPDKPGELKGVDPHYIRFHCCDVFTVDLSQFDLLVGSPPCSAHTSLPALSNGRAPSKAPKLITHHFDSKRLV